MRYTLLAFLLLIGGALCLAKRTETVEATYTYYAPESMTIEEAKKIACTRAQTEAIAEAFGTTISQANSIIMSNNNGDSNTRFYSNGISAIKGEWIETLSSPKYEISYQRNQLIVKCHVKGKVREIINPEIELHAKVLKNGTSSRFEANDFRDGDELYLLFQSSADGRIYVFLQQNNVVYRLLPYKDSKELGLPISKDRTYVFFSINNDSDGEVDEYTLYADYEIDLADIIIFYIPNSAGTPPSGSVTYDEPLSTDIHSFNSWLVKKRNKDERSRLISIPITIRKL